MTSISPRLAGWTVGLALVSCLGCQDTRSYPVQRTQLSRAPVDPDPEAERAPSWAADVGRSIERGLQLGAASRVAPATVADRAYDSRESVPVRRLVYRVSIAVPDGLKAPHPPMLPSPAELHMDVGIDRLRARFQGAAWPIDEGSEIRLRADIPGVYLFDGAGGRPIGPGMLSSWFAGDEGHPTGREYFEIRRDAGPLLEGPAELVCVLIAEWTNQSREALAQHCSGGAIPPSFRFGIWVAEITAIVPMTMLRFQLRADAVDAPRSISISSTRVKSLLDARDIARLPPFPLRSVPTLPPVEAPPSGRATLKVTNHERARVLVIVQGMPLAWLQPGAVAEFSGFEAGYYRVGALRPFSQNVSMPAPLAIPGALEVGFAREEAQLEPPRPSTSPDAAR